LHPYTRQYGIVKRPKQRAELVKTAHRISRSQSLAQNSAGPR